MSAPDQAFLPKEPLDLPRPHDALPADFPKNAEPEPQQQASSAGYNEEAYTVRTLLTWHAPGRPYKKRKREFYFNSFLIMLALEIIIFLFHEYTLMILVMAVWFLSYALSAVRPHDFYYKISSEGVTVEDHSFLWQELYDFYFKHYAGEEVLILRTQAYLPGELVLTLGAIHKEQIKQLLLPFLPYREYMKPTLMEKSGDWLSKTFPLERSEA